MSTSNTSAHQPAPPPTPAAGKKRHSNPNLALAPRCGARTPRRLPLPRSGDPRRTPLPHAWRAEHRTAHRGRAGPPARSPHHPRALQRRDPRQGSPPDHRAAPLAGGARREAVSRLAAARAGRPSGPHGTGADAAALALRRVEPGRGPRGVAGGGRSPCTMEARHCRGRAGGPVGRGTDDRCGRSCGKGAARTQAPEAWPVAAATSRVAAPKPHAPVPRPSFGLRQPLLASTSHSTCLHTPPPVAA